MKSLFKSKAHLSGFLILVILGLIVLNKDAIMTSMASYEGLKAENELRRTELYQTTYDTTLAHFISWQGITPDDCEFILQFGGTAEQLVYTCQYGYVPEALPQVTGDSLQKATKQLAVKDAVRDYYASSYGNTWQEQASEEIEKLKQDYDPTGWFESAKENFIATMDARLQAAEAGAPIDYLTRDTALAVIYEIGEPMQEAPDPLEPESEWTTLPWRTVKVFADTNHTDYHFHYVPLGFFQYGSEK